LEIPAANLDEKTKSTGYKYSTLFFISSSLNSSWIRISARMISPMDNRSLPAIGDSSVANPFVVQPQEIRVMRHENPAGGGRERELLRIFGSSKAAFSTECDIDPTAVKASGDAVRHILVQVEPDWHRLRCFFDAFLS
jgi:hypothetical protein